MARQGPVNVRISYNRTGGAIAAAHVLDDILELGGGAITRDMADDSAFGDAVRGMVPTGTRSVSDIELGFPYDPAADTAFSVIGRPHDGPAATPGRLEIKFSGDMSSYDAADGTKKTYRVYCTANDPVASLDDQTRAAATFAQAAGAATGADAVLTEDYAP